MGTEQITPQITAASIKGNLQGRKYRLVKRKKPSGEQSPFWYVVFKIGGRELFHSTGTTSVAAAHLVAKKKLKVAMEGRWSTITEGKIKQDAPTLGELIKIYTARMPARAKVGARSIRGYVSAMRSMVRTVHGDGVDMESLRATVLTRDMVKQFKDLRYPVKGTHGEIDRAVTTINSTITQARGLFSRQARELYHDEGLILPDLTGFLGVGKFKDERDVSFRPIPPATLAQIDAAAWKLLQADATRRVTLPDGTLDDRLVPARPDLLLAYLMARYLGMRDIEIVAARWDWIEKWPDGERMAIVKRDYFHPKYSEGRVPIAPELCEALRKYGDPEIPWIIPSASATKRNDVVYRDTNFFLRQWLRDREKAMHELRKQAGSEIYTQTKSLSMAAEFLRNKEETCRKHYATMLVPPPALRLAIAMAA